MIYTGVPGNDDLRRRNIQSRLQPLVVNFLWDFSENGPTNDMGR